MHPHHRGAVIDRVGAGSAVDHIGARTADQRVIAIAAQQRVVAQPADQAVIAGTAFEHVIASAAGQRIVMARPDQMFDTADLIAIGIAPDPDRAIEPDFDSRVGPGVVNRIKAGAADQRVGPGRTQQRVIAIAAIEHFGATAATQGVIKARADDLFDIGQCIAFGIAASVGLAIQPDVHRLGRGRIAGGVETRTPVERIGAGATNQRIVADAPQQSVVAVTAIEQVIACTAFEQFVGTRTGDRVVARRADDMFDAVERIAGRLPALRNRAIGVDVDRRGRA